MIRNIIQIGNPKLRVIAKEVSVNEIASEKIQNLIDDLIETMRDANGAGLAATQIGESLRICVIEVKNNIRYPYKPNIPLTVLINPVITYLSEDNLKLYEGCLSVPNIRGEIERCAKIRVQFLDRYGSKIDIISQGITAGTFQHEVDHLDGILFLDKVKNPHKITTIKEFSKFHEKNFIKVVKEVVSKYGS